MASLRAPTYHPAHGRRGGYPDSRSIIAELERELAVIEEALAREGSAEV